MKKNNLSRFLMCILGLMYRKGPKSKSKSESKKVLLAILSKWETGISKQISNGEQLSPPKNKFGKGYKHDKSHF